MTARAWLLGDEEYEALMRMVYGKTGLAFDGDKRELFESRVRKRLEEKGMRPAEYVRLLASPGSDAELRQLIDLLTVNETYFFRDLPQLTVFARAVLPDIYEQKLASSWPKIRLWSAGCSIGCEAYTLAIIVLEHFRQHPPVPVEIVGTDISPSVLEVARKGLYTDREVRDVPEPFLERYFVRGQDYWTPRAEVRRIVRFQYGNLLDPEDTRLMRGFDVIFCRNVLIYFDDESRRRAAQVLYDALREGGYVFLGHAESMSRISRSFRLKRVG
ncbi:MAG: protein-glutamate O-methyltransferase CheR, partial [Bacillota bacterium]